MNQVSTASVKIIPSTAGAHVAGITSRLLSSGTATFSSLIFTSSPGVRDIRYKLTSSLLDLTQIKYGTQVSESSLYVSFRHCMPGEIQQGNECLQCGYGSYSFDWNATKCENCMSNADCLGGSQVNVDSGYWRRTTNSTKIIRCLHDDACSGGFLDGSDHPVECKKGYKGIM